MALSALLVIAALGAPAGDTEQYRNGAFCRDFGAMENVIALFIDRRTPEDSVREANASAGSPTCFFEYEPVRVGPLKFIKQIPGVPEFGIFQTTVRGRPVPTENGMVELRSSYSSFTVQQIPTAGH